MLAKALASASASAAKVYVEDVFSTWLYTGNGSTQTITNGIDLSGKGGLVWIKNRNVSNYASNLVDSARGTGKTLISSSTTAEVVNTDVGLTAFNSNGFTTAINAGVAENGTAFASWTFRKAAKFFDVVTWTGNGATGTISHNLGSVPGCIIVKRTDASFDWYVYHRSQGETKAAQLNATDAFSGSAAWDNTAPTSTQFTWSSILNASGATYVAYLFAHDAGGFGDSGNDSVVKCGSFTTPSVGGVVDVNLGWEPQWILFKSSSNTGSWYIIDNMRGWSVGSADQLLSPNNANEEASVDYGHPTATGFTTAGLNSSQTYIYIAIRRGPMKTPTDATKVFNASTYGQNSLAAYYLGAPVDLAMVGYRSGSTNNAIVRQRLTSDSYMFTSQTSAETSSSGTGFAQMFGYQAGGVSPDTTFIGWLFRRAPGFFDVVAYTGTGSARTVNHNLGVAPELIVTKVRSAAGYWWAVYAAPLGATNFLLLNSSTGNFAPDSTYWNDTAPTASVFSVGANSRTNLNGGALIAYLFASCPGVSKVGSYTGTNTTLNVDCGFTNGARFVLIKRTNSGGFGDWYVFDSARGIVSGNDPYLALNRTDAENFFGSADAVDPYPAGFSLPGGTLINESGGEFIYLAIA